MEKITVKYAKETNDYVEGKKRILEYVDWLGVDLSFQNFDNEINDLPKMYGVPNGSLIIAMTNETTIGVAGIRKLDNDVCELKRMYVQPRYRKLGIGDAMMQLAIKYAKSQQYKKMKLDTDKSMNQAISLYLKTGFVEIPPYRFNPYETALYFELDLENSNIQTIENELSICF